MQSPKSPAAPAVPEPDSKQHVFFNDNVTLHSENQHAILVYKGSSYLLFSSWTARRQESGWACALSKSLHSKNPVEPIRRAQQPTGAGRTFNLRIYDLRIRDRSAEYKFIPVEAPHLAARSRPVMIKMMQAFEVRVRLCALLK